MNVKIILSISILFAVPSIYPITPPISKKECGLNIAVYSSAVIAGLCNLYCTRYRDFGFVGNKSQDNLTDFYRRDTSWGHTNEIFQQIDRAVSRAQVGFLFIAYGTYGLCDTYRNYKRVQQSHGTRSIE